MAGTDQLSAVTDNSHVSTQTNESVRINELLCFISNKSETMTYELVVKLCVGFYDEAIIKESKDEIWEVLDATSFPDNHSKPRKKSHRGSDKKKKDIEDKLNVFLELPPASVPVYVAKATPCQYG